MKKQKTPRKPGAARTDWTPERRQVVRDRYPHEPSGPLAASLGVSVDSLYTKARRLGVQKTQAYLDSPASGRTDGRIGAATRFQPGCTPWSKGRKGLRHSNANWFTPGQRPANYLPVGSSRIHAGYRWTKVAEGSWPGAWKPAHHIVWEAANGPVPPGHLLRFRDKDRAHIALDNLELLSKQEWFARITFYNYPLALVRVVRTRALLNRMINQRNPGGRTGPDETRSAG